MPRFGHYDYLGVVIRTFGFAFAGVYHDEERYPGVALGDWQATKIPMQTAHVERAGVVVAVRLALAGVPAVTLAASMCADLLRA